MLFLVVYGLQVVLVFSKRVDKQKIVKHPHKNFIIFYRYAF